MTRIPRNRRELILSLIEANVIQISMVRSHCKYEHVEKGKHCKIRPSTISRLEACALEYQEYGEDSIDSEKWEAELKEALDLMITQAERALPKSKRSPFYRIWRESGEPEYVYKLIEALGNLEIADTDILSVYLDNVSKSTVSRWVNKALEYGLIEVTRAYSPMGNSRKVDFYQLSPMGVNCFRTKFNKKTSFCDCDFENADHFHRIATYRLAYLFPLGPWDELWGTCYDSYHRIEIDCYIQGERKLIPDVYFRLDDKILAGEVEMWGTLEDFHDKIRRYMNSAAFNVLVVLEAGASREEYERAIHKEMRRAGQVCRGKGFYVENLPDVLDGHLDEPISWDDNTERIRCLYSE